MGDINRHTGTEHNVFDGERVHVLSEMCETCVFRPGNQMHLAPGRLRGMVDGAREDMSSITCHSTLETDQQAVCRGFYDRHSTPPLEVAKNMGLIAEDQPPTKKGA